MRDSCPPSGPASCSIAVCILLLLTGSARADSALDPAQCDAASVADASECLAALRLSAEGILERTLAQARAAIDAWFAPDTPNRERELAAWHRAFDSAQSQWERFVSTDCSLLHWEYFRGAGETAATERCRLAHLELRIKALEERYGT